MQSDTAAAFPTHSRILDRTDSQHTLERTLKQHLRQKGEVFREVRIHASRASPIAARASRYRVSRSLDTIKDLRPPRR
jgi:hypothetical protein